MSELTGGVLAHPRDGRASVVGGGASGAGQGARKGPLTLHLGGQVSHLGLSTPSGGAWAARGTHNRSRFLQGRGQRPRVHGCASGEGALGSLESRKVPGNSGPPPATKPRRAERRVPPGRAGTHFQKNPLSENSHPLLATGISEKWLNAAHLLPRICVGYPRPTTAPSSKSCILTRGGKAW